MTLEEIKKIKCDECPAFSDFARDQMPMPGKKKRLDEILDKKITIADYRLRRSKHRDGSQCLQLQFLLDGEVFVLFTGSSVLIHQVEVSHDKMPFSGTITKIDRYYSFS